MKTSILSPEQYAIRTRLPYAGLALLSLPSLFFSFILLSDMIRGGVSLGIIDFIGFAFGIFLASVSLYGLIAGKRFLSLPTAIKVMTITASLVALIYLAAFALMLVVFVTWK